MLKRQLYMYDDYAYLLDEVDARLQIESKVDEVPLEPLLAVLLLLQHKHVVVEELLQLLVRQVDAQLLEGVHLKREGEHAHREEMFIVDIYKYGFRHQYNSILANFFKLLHCTWKISNPAISRTPMKKFRRDLVSRVLLILCTSHLNMRSYMLFDRAPMENRTCSEEVTN